MGRILVNVTRQHYRGIVARSHFFRVGGHIL